MIIRLASPRIAPWGLMTDGEHPVPLVWLTEKRPVAEISEEKLPYNAIEALSQSIRMGLVIVEGWEAEKEEALLPSILSPPSIQGKIFNVADLVQEKEIRVKEESPTFIHLLKIGAILKDHARVVIKNLNQAAEKDKPLDFFRLCKKEEEAGKSRKTVLRCLKNIMEEKISRLHVSVDSEKLDKEYFNLVEEEEWNEEDYEGLL